MNTVETHKPNRLRSAKRFSKRVLKGKVFHKSEFSTGLLDKTLRGALYMKATRTDGFRKAPVRLDLPATQTSANEQAPVRIFVGTEPAQHRAERVFLWSVLKQRDPSRDYQVYLMTDIAKFSRKAWKTGFTGYRYAIPEWAGFDGRAIYNDVDQIYLTDPAQLFDMDMQGASVLAVDSRDTAVMLMDCANLRGVWDIKTVQSMPGKLHTDMLRRARAGKLIADLPGCWNSRDHEYDADSSCLLHYTILHTQPWRPFPRDLRYRDNPLGSLWQALEDEADRENFAPIWKLSQDANYSEMAPHFTLVRDE